MNSTLPLRAQRARRTRVRGWVRVVVALAVLGAVRLAYVAGQDSGYVTGYRTALDTP